MTRFKLSVPAERDLDEIVVYLAENASPQVARRVVARLKQAMRFLASRPQAGHRREDLTDQPYLFWGVYSYLIVFDPAKRPIEIVRVIHGARDTRAIL